MLGKKLILVFNSMNGVEKRAFSKFLASPYYNQRSELLSYWGYLQREYAEGGEKFDPTKIYETIYPSKEYDLKQFRHMTSWLLKKIEQFFVVRKREKEDFEQQLSLAKVYREKKLDELFERRLGQAMDKVREQRLDPKRFLEVYQIEYEQYAYIESNKRTATNNLQGLNDSLDEYLLVSKLKQSCLMLAHQAVYQIQYDFSFLDQLLGFLEEHPLLENPAIGLYYHCYRAFNENDSAHFYQFKNLLKLQQQKFSTQEVRALLLFALNFCIRQMNDGKNNFAKEAWDFYLLGLEQKLLYENDYLGRFTYKNITALGIKLKEFDWTQQFVDEYKEDLAPKFKENYFNYNKAQLHFALREYAKAMPLLAMLDDSDLLLNFDAKVILIKMYYELEEFDALDSLLDSFSVMIQRKKVIGYHKDYYKELIQLTKKLLELTTGKSAKRSALRDKILAKEKFPEKAWFLRMVG